MNGRTFIITEPWGDNSRYTIHQRPVEPSPELDAIREAFARYCPSPLFSGGRSFTLFLLSAAALILLLAVAVGWLSS